VCLNVLRSRNTRREEPLGVHMPDPVISRIDGTTPEDEALLADSVGLALQVVLETLTPAERLAFVLHDMFDLPFDQIAPMVGRSPDAARQLASRARRRVRGAEVQAPDSDLARQREVVDAFFAAAHRGDFDALVARLGKELKIRRYIKSYPLTTIHPWAYRAASAGRCFFDLQGPESFFAWKSQVYARQDEMTVPGIDSFAMDYAYANEIPDEKFRGCYLQAKSNDKIHADLTEGWALRVRSTPTYFIDGVYVSWFADNLMEEFLRTTYLGGRGLPLPTPAASPAAPKH